MPCCKTGLLLTNSTTAMSEDTKNIFLLLKAFTSKACNYEAHAGFPLLK